MTYARAAALVLATLAVTGTIAAQDTGRPAFSIPRTGGEVVAGAYAGFVGFYAGRFAGERVADLVSLEDEGGVRRGAVLTFAYLGAAFGTAGTVYGIGSLGNQTGEFGAALLGTGAGFVVAVAANRLLFPRASREANGARSARRLADAVEILLPAIGSAVAFNSTRRYSR